MNTHTKNSDSSIKITKNGTRLSLSQYLGSVLVGDLTNIASNIYNSSTKIVLSTTPPVNSRLTIILPT
jgi:hypothetical protein